MVRKPKYAPYGFSYCSVETPQLFAEYLLPNKIKDYTEQDRKNQWSLDLLAEIYDTHVHRSPYERG